MRVEESKVAKEVFEGLARNTRINYETTLKQFLAFVNSKERLSKKFSINDLVEEAKSDVRKTQERIDQFYRWLQNQKVEGYQ